MSPEEKPPEEIAQVTTPGSSNEFERAEIPDLDVNSPQQREPVMAEQVNLASVESDGSPEIVDAERIEDHLTNFGPGGLAFSNAPPLVGNLENMSANGGAIGSLVLGVWCVIGSFITNWSIINGVIGLLMGLWGLTSRKQRTAWIGIMLCVVGIFMSLIQVSELVNMYLTEVEENAF